MKKAVPLDEAVAMVREGAVVMVGGFMGVGSPQDRSGRPSRRRAPSAVRRCRSILSFGVAAVIRGGRLGGCVSPGSAELDGPRDGHGWATAGGREDP